MEIKNKKSFNNLLESLVEELLDEEELEEFNTTGSVGGAYSTPFAFDPDDKKNKNDYKSKKNSHRKKIGEALESKDLDKQDIEVIRKLIRDVISDGYRDIWIKRNSWK